MCSDQNSSELSLVIQVQLVGLVMNVCNQAPGIATWKMEDGNGVGPMLDSRLLENTSYRFQFGRVVIELSTTWHTLVYVFLHPYVCLRLNPGFSGIYLLKCTVSLH